MRPIVLSVLLVSMLSVTLCSCHKDHPTSATTTTTTTSNTGSKLNIRLTYPTLAYSVNYELIITEESTGKEILDTLASAGSTISASPQTSDSFFNVTTAAILPQDTIFEVTTITHVNPQNWQYSLPHGYDLNPSVPTATTANIIYTNPPVTSSNNFILDNFKSVDFINIDGINNDFVCSFQKYGNNPVLLLIPELHLYNWHTMTSNQDTVDLTHMDTAISVKYTYPSSYSQFYCYLYGYADTNNYSNCALLYSPEVAIWQTSVEYPTTGVEKYEMVANFNDINDHVVTYWYTYGNTVPPTAPTLPTPASYNLVSSQSSLFSLSWVNVSPAYYRTTWVINNNFSWNIYSPGDSTTQHPQTLMNSISSKILKGQSIGNPSFYMLDFETPQGLDYAGFFNYTCDSTLLKNQRLPSSIIYSRSF